MELAACRLSSLPTHLANLAPNLRALNLNYNFLVDGTVKSLEGLGRLAKLTIVGSRFGETKPLIRIVRGMPEMELVDFRYVCSNCQFEFRVLIVLNFVFWVASFVLS
jgi:protein NUD1